MSQPSSLDHFAKLLYIWQTNVIVDDNENAVLCDIGLASVLDGGVTGFTSSNFAGSLRFMSPEFLDESQATAFTDIYSIGCTCMQVREDFGHPDDHTARSDRSDLVFDVSSSIQRHQDRRTDLEGNCNWRTTLQLIR